METKFTVADYKKEVYKEFKDEIDFISKSTERANWKADIGVATDMFITLVESIEENAPEDMLKIKARVAELNAKRTDLC